MYAWQEICAFKTTSTAFVLSAFTEQGFFQLRSLQRNKKIEDSSPQPEQPGTTGQTMLEYGGTFQGKKAQDRKK